MIIVFIKEYWVRRQETSHSVNFRFLLDYFGIWASVSFQVKKDEIQKYRLPIGELLPIAIKPEA